MKIRFEIDLPSRNSRFYKYLLVVLVLSLSAAVVNAGHGPTVHPPNIFSSGDVIKSSEFNANFNHLADRSWDRDAPVLGVYPNTNLYYNSGNVGIGTSIPGAKLEVAGQVKITGGAPSAGKVLTSDTTGLASWQTPSSGADSDWTVSGIDMYSAVSGNVGIGTTTPGAKLEISHGANQWLQVKPYSTISNKIVSSGGLGIAIMGNENNIPLDIDGSGNVGIGTDTPGAKLEVAGQVKITGGTPGAGKVLTSDTVGLASWQTPSGGGDFSNGGEAGGANRTLGNTDNFAFGFLTNGTERMSITGSGLVGIGTTNPGAKLQIKGTGTGTSQALLINNSANAVNVTLFDNGNFGLGDQGPDATLEVVKRGTTDLLNLSSTTAGDGDLMTVTDTGKVGIGTISPDDGRVEVKGGSVCVDTDSDDIASSCIANESDIRLKKNIKSIESPLEKLQKIRGVTFDWRWDEYDQVKRFKAMPHGIGVIAQEVEEVFPEALNEDIGKFKSVNYEALVAPLIEAVKELKTENETLAKKNEALESKNEGLELALEETKEELNKLKIKMAKFESALEKLETLTAAR